MLQRVENEHKTKLEQLSRMKIEQDSALSFTRNDESTPATNQGDVSFASFRVVLFVTEAKLLLIRPLNRFI